MKWTELRALNDLDIIRKESTTHPVLIFKYSHRCHISKATLDRLERHWNEAEMANVRPYFLDLLTYREVSDGIAETFGVEHESPQVLLIRDGASVLDLSHFGISYDDIRAAIKS